MRTRCLFALSLLFISSQIIGQISSMGFEVVEVHSGTYADGVDLDGYVTFDLFLYTQEPATTLMDIYSIDEGTPGVMDATDFHLSFEGAVFQHELAGMYGNENDCSMWDTSESMRFDSFVTFDDTTSCALNNPFNEVISIPTQADVESAFEGPVNGNYFDGGDFWMDEGSLNRLCDEETPSFGPDLKFRVARITTNGSFSGYFKSRVCCPADMVLDGAWTDILCENDTVVNGQDTTIVICQGLPFSCNTACFLPSNQINNTVIAQPIQCHGETGGLNIGSQDNPSVVWDIVDSETGQTIISGSTDTSISGLDEGCYSIEFIDDQGCTSQGAACLVEPSLLQASLDISLDPCSDGAWACVSGSGGTPGYDYSINGDFGSCQFVDCWNGFVLGTVTDNNGCVATADDVFFCESPIEVSVNSIQGSCGASCNGEATIVFDAFNPSPTITIYQGVVQVFQEYNAYSGFVVEGLCAGSYTAVVETFGECPGEVWFQVGQESLTVDVSTQDPTCIDPCSGEIVVDVDSNEGYSILCEDELGTEVGLTDLCAGVYTCTVTTDSGCTDSQEVEILDPFDNGPDLDDDGVVDCVDNCLTIPNPDQADFNNDGVGDACSDTDNDGLMDAEEFDIGTDPLLQDTDGDGLTDGLEVAYGFDPTNIDSDGDGCDDVSELSLQCPDSECGDCPADFNNDSVVNTHDLLAFLALFGTICNAP